MNTLQLLTTFSQFEWRIPKFWSSLLELFQNNLGNNYKLVREILPSCASLAISYDVDYSIQLPENESYSNPSNKDGQMSNIDIFVNYLQTKLDEAIALFDVIGDKNNDKSKELQRSKINEFIFGIFIKLYHIRCNNLVTLLKKFDV